MSTYTQGQQHQAKDVTTVMASAVAANRFIAYDGVCNRRQRCWCQGISQAAAAIGESVPVVTGYSYLLACSEALAVGDYVKPAVDGSGRGAKGTATDKLRAMRWAASRSRTAGGVPGGQARARISDSRCLTCTPPFPT